MADNKNKFKPLTKQPPLSQTEEAFRKIANQYADTVGREFMQELSDQNSPIGHLSTDMLDAKTNRNLTLIKRRKYIALAIGLTACILLILFSSNIYGFFKNQTGIGHLQDSEKIANESEYNDNPITEPDYRDNPITEPDYQIITLDFSLSPEFMITDIQQDHEKTVYHIRDTMHDDVVMTLKKSDDPIYSKGLDTFELKQYAIYRKSEKEFKFLTFKKDDIIYELTCRHELETLMTLSEEIL